MSALVVAPKLKRREPTVTGQRKRVFRFSSLRACNSGNPYRSRGRPAAVLALIRSSRERTLQIEPADIFCFRCCQDLLETRRDQIFAEQSRSPRSVLNVKFSPFANHHGMKAKW